MTKKHKKEFVLNPSRKSAVCILHEYVQHSLKKQPVYTYHEMDSSATPYSATVVVNGIKYGTGLGSSKKVAKTEAAAKSLEIMIPEYSQDKRKELEEQMPDLKYFDDVSITDPRVPDLCNRVNEPSPFAILITCLNRNYGLGDTSIHTELRPLRHKKNEFYMRVHQKEVTVVCKNKKDGKQSAAQELLQQLHPHIKSWGALLRLYGSRAIFTQKARKEKEADVTSLQKRSSARPFPSLAILDKLKEEMRNLSERKKSVVPLLGKFVPPTVPAAAGAHPELEKDNL